MSRSSLETQVLPYNEASIRAAAQLVLDGLPVAVPTETVYGLAADATNARAVARIYEAKGRPSFNPLIVHVPDLETAKQIGEFDAAALSLAKDHWPGPLTLVVPLKSTATISSLALAGLQTIALRVPAHAAMQALLRATNRPLAAPSANESGSISPTRAEHVRKTLDGRIPLIIDAGATERGIESTIVSVVDGSIRLLRPGPILVDAAQTENGKIEAPGQLASHYAPRKPLRLNALAGTHEEFLIGFGAIIGTESLSPSGDLVEAASRLFDLLHEADSSEMARISVAPVPIDGLGQAINDRLRRAAHRE